VGSWIWCFALAFVGAKLGAQWDNNPALRSTFHSLDAAILAVLALGIIWFVWHRLSSRRTKTAPSPER
jgi:membrane protein DedA with SNARE-associated domain